MLPTRRSMFSPFVLCLLMGVFNNSASLAQQISSANRSKIAFETGRRTYNSSCAGCHGLDGSGSDKAVDISGTAKVRHLSDAQLSGIISNGVPGTGMPAFHTLSERQIRSLVDYLRSLQGKHEVRTLPGNPERGKAIFFGKGDCSSCHTISGEGGFLGPDLSGYGTSASAKTIREEIVRSARTPPQGYRSAVLTTAAGDRLEGLIRNEDNFSLQFQTKDGDFHVFEKSALRTVDRLDTSVMPTNYGQRLSPNELNDLVSYLLAAAPEASQAGSSHKNEEEEETE